MEMIAMLGGLGATQPGFSPEGAAFATQISATKNAAELMVVVAAIDAASLRPDEKSALKVIAMEKKDSFDSIFRKPGYWITVAVVLGAAWYHRDKIKRALGLSGLGAFDPRDVAEEYERERERETRSFSESLRDKFPKGGYSIRRFPTESEIQAAAAARTDLERRMRRLR
jgi:hypothetical protein